MLGVQTPALPASLRRTNQRTVISLLMRLGAASRADLAKVAGISQPTAGKITSELLELGVLQQAGSTAGEATEGPDGSPRLGRPGQLLRLDDRRRRFVVVELGVTETRLATLPVAVRLTDEWARRFPTPRSPEAWLKGLKLIADELNESQLWGVLVSVPGIVDESAGQVLFSPNLHWLERIDLAKLAGEVWNLPAVLVQEIRALAWGHLTAEPAGEDFLLVDFGQGVGGAIVLDGKLYAQPQTLSGEFGHSPVPGNSRRCGCGAVGCLETLVSERGLIESFLAAGLGSEPGNKRAAWPLLVTRVREHGIEPWLGDTLSATAKVIAGALNILGVHRVIVTGLLAEMPGAIEHLGAEIQAGTLWARFGQVVCQAAPRRRAAGLVGAGLDRLVLPASEDQGRSPLK